MQNRMERLFWHSPCAASYTVYPSFWKVTLYNTFSNLTSHTPFSLHTKWRCCLLFTHTTPTCCEKLPTATLTISKSNWVREIHLGFFLFFLWMFCEAVVMVMGYKDSSGSQCTHEWEDHWVCVCECVCLCLCVMHNSKDNALKRLGDDLSPISWMWCVFYCLLSKGW